MIYGNMLIPIYYVVDEYGKTKVIIAMVIIILGEIIFNWLSNKD